MRRARRILMIAMVALLVLGALWAIGLFLPIINTPVNHGPAMGNTVALTFDDGPSPATSLVLDELRRGGVRATFFVVGANVRRYPEIARRAVAEGHQIGLHSDGHSRLLPFLLPPQVGHDTTRVRKAVQAAAGVNPRYYRAPHGESSPWMRWSLSRDHLTLMGWNISPNDWAPGPASEVERRVLQEAKPGSVILLHDGLDVEPNPDRSRMLEALPGIIRGLQDRGYRLVTVAELLGGQAYRS